MKIRKETKTKIFEMNDTFRSVVRTLRVLNHGSSLPCSATIKHVQISSLIPTFFGQGLTVTTLILRARKALLPPFSVVRQKQISDYLGCALPLHSKCHCASQIVGNLFAAFNQRLLPFTYASTCKVHLIQMGLPFSKSLLASATELKGPLLSEGGFGGA
jgi:hypothetical protein